MIDPFEDFTVGVEFNIGNKENTYNGEFNNGGKHESLSVSRLAQRVSFGVFYNF
jgi:hypothetical protein